MILSRVRTIVPDVPPKDARLKCAFSAGDTWSGWDINTHGIQIDFVDSQGSHRSATYVDVLPGQRNCTLLFFYAIE
jgi:hypothetical protein